MGNIAYVVALFGVMRATENVMHPPGPMVESDFGRIQLFFGALTALLIFAALQVARLFRKLPSFGENSPAVDGLDGEAPPRQDR